MMKKLRSQKGNGETTERSARARSCYHLLVGGPKREGISKAQELEPKGEKRYCLVSGR